MAFKSIFFGSYKSIGFTILTDESNIMYGSNNQNGSLALTENEIVPGSNCVVFTVDGMLVYINGELDPNIVLFEDNALVNDYDNSVWYLDQMCF